MPTIQQTIRESQVAIRDSYQWLRQTGLAMVKQYKLTRCYANPADIKHLKADILLSPNDKLLNMAVDDHREHLKAHYPLDRLQWIVQFSELYFDVGWATEGFKWWSLYWTILGKSPGERNFPHGVNWYWIVRRYYRQYDKEYRDKVCKDFFERHPEAVHEVGNLELPVQFDEIAQEVSPQELYAYWKYHMAVLDKTLDKLLENSDLI